MYISHGPPEFIIRSLDALTRADLQSLRDSYFGWLIMFAAIVAIGIVLEGPELVHETLRIFRCHKGRAPRWVVLLALFGWILVVLGVAGEVVAESLVARSEGILQEFNGILLTEATKQAGNAKSSADASANAAQRARDESDKATESALKASALASRARKEVDVASRTVSELQRALRVQGPRWRLLEAGKNEFVKALRPFAGQRIIFIKCGTMGGLEPSKLESDLRNFLGDGGAGWVEGNDFWKKCDSTWDFGGNLVVFGPAASDAVKDAAESLGRMLNTLKITTITAQPTREHRPVDLIVFGDDSPFEVTAKDPTAIVLLVGLHPMFDLAGAE